MSDTIQSAEDYSNAFINAVEHAIITGTTASLIKGSIDIATLIKQRDAAIRADEARKQAERYAACVDLAWKALKAINGMRFPENHPALVLFPELNKALADLEAPK
jgi:aspartate/methionine/tyrosine aminotransferase